MGGRGGLDQCMKGTWGGRYQENEKHLINIYTVTCRLKNAILLLS